MNSTRLNSPQANFLGSPGPGPPSLSHPMTVRCHSQQPSPSSASGQRPHAHSTTLNPLAQKMAPSLPRTRQRHLLRKSHQHWPSGHCLPLDLSSNSADCHHPAGPLLSQQPTSHRQGQAGWHLLCPLPSPALTCAHLTSVQPPLPTPPCPSLRLPCPHACSQDISIHTP